jgi:uncharacterized protein
MSELHDNPDSPCIGVCSTLFDEECKGCGRTAQEVAEWVFLDPKQRAEIVARVEQEARALKFKF